MCALYIRGHTNGLEGVGGGEPYSELSQQVEEAEAEVTGESFTNHDRYSLA